MGAVLRRGGDLDEGELAGDVGIAGDVVDIDDVLKFVERRANAVAGFGTGLAYESEAREAGTL
jgi:hypothetical protein